MLFQSFSFTSSQPSTTFRITAAEQIPTGSSTPTTDKTAVNPLSAGSTWIIGPIVAGIFFILVVVVVICWRRKR